jgi:hypothetical protein
MVKSEGTHRPETVHPIKLCSEAWLLSTLNEQRSFAAPSSLGRPYIVQTTTRPAHASPDAMTLLYDAGCRRCWMKMISGTHPVNSYLHGIKKVKKDVVIW